jgi:NAD+ synthase (glutamine-hydrolysing)
MNKYGFVRVVAATPEVVVGNCEQNAKNIIAIIKEFRDAQIIVFPELSITGYTCGDLFAQPAFLQSALNGLQLIRNSISFTGQLVVVGMPLAINNALYNCAIVINGNQIVGIVPKQHLPNYKEFYEARWFKRPDGSEPKCIHIDNVNIPFGTDLLFNVGDAVVGIEICEDLFVPIPPSSYQALGGANIICNLSASNELVAKGEYRKELVCNQSARCIAAYIYTSAGPSESTADVVYSGDRMIVENGTVLARDRMNHGTIATDIDVQKLQLDRRVMTSFSDDWPKSRRYISIPYTRYPTNQSGKYQPLVRYFDPHPFVPANPATLSDRCREILDIQCLGLRKRLAQLPNVQPYIGVSGGLDSTLALLVLCRTWDTLQRPRKDINAVCMRGFGTSEKTQKNADALIAALGINRIDIDIRAGVLEDLRAEGHKPFGIDIANMGVDEFQELIVDLPEDKRHDLHFENAQARKRTYHLMNMGFTIGTGDLSEIALGWCTYNADHMSMYNVNCSIPKTLVKFLVDYIAEQIYASRPWQTFVLKAKYPKISDEGPYMTNDTTELRVFSEILTDIVSTTISPELLPTKNGKIAQSTEDTLGPYELHDFFMFHFLRNGFGPEKILYISQFVQFDQEYSKETITKTLGTFITRFFANQFKRECVPNGPKVGSVSLSPRGDWRMPPDADPTEWLNQLDPNRIDPTLVMTPGSLPGYVRVPASSVKISKISNGI